MNGRLRAMADGDIRLRVRLARYRAAHPQAVVGDIGFGGTWQARLPEPDGEHVYTRHRLEELMDLLDALDTPPDTG